MGGFRRPLAPGSCPDFTFCPVAAQPVDVAERHIMQFPQNPRKTDTIKVSLQTGNDYMVLAIAATRSAAALWPLLLVSTGGRIKLTVAPPTPIGYCGQNQTNKQTNMLASLDGLPLWNSGTVLWIGICHRHNCLGCSVYHIVSCTFTKDIALLCHCATYHQGLKGFNLLYNKLMNRHIVALPL